jgi:uncharacterized protein YcfJ
MKHSLTLLSLTTALLCSSSIVLAKGADYRDNYRNNSYVNERHYDEKHHHKNNEMARVIHVEPIYTSVRVKTPHQHDCYRSSHQNSYTTTIAGGIIGGVIGNQFGKGSGKTALTVAGTLLGGSVGHDLNRDQSNYYKSQTTCQVSQHYRHEQRIDGYHVTYRYNGKQYSTEMEHHPGKYIPVNVSVVPTRQYHR